MSFKPNPAGMRKLERQMQEVTKDFEREVNEIATKHAGEGEASLLRRFREAARKRGIEPDETFFRNLARRLSSEAKQAES